MAVAAHHNGYYDWTEFQLALIDAIRRWEGDEAADAVALLRALAGGAGDGALRHRRARPAPSSTIAAHTIITTPRDANHHHARREPVMVDPAH